ncbi:MAG: MFS transporter [Bdellovibrionales bacterium]|nr:MFS transporter [Bdellovibrionales bacterium]
MSNTNDSNVPGWIIPLLAVAVGITAANLYYAQPLVSLIAQSLNLSPGVAGLVTTLTQIGYGIGVLFIIPLGDLVENKKLIVGMLSLTVFALIGLAFSSQLVPYFIAAFLLGLGASAVQIIVPYSAHLTHESIRGKVVGNLMSGLMVGIMLSRPIASFLTDLFSWHAVFILSAALMLALTTVLYKYLPKSKPANTSIKYTELIASMGKLFVETPVLRRRGIYQAFLFGAFCLFWTATPLYLSSPVFGLTQTGIALFALAGIAGAVVAPLAGRYADKGKIRQATTIAMISASLSFLLTHIFAPGSTMSLAFLVISAIMLDAGISANLVLGQRAIFSLKPEHRSRLNGLYIAMIFVGGAFGSMSGAWAFAHGGWSMTSYVGFALPMCALLYFSTEFLGRKK